MSRKKGKKEDKWAIEEREKEEDRQKERRQKQEGQKKEGGREEERLMGLKILTFSNC